MCSGTHELSKKKYIYDGLDDCISANRLSGGDKLCPNGCIGLGTCAAACKFDAIHIINGVAAVDYKKCTACGACVASCPKSIIKLVPYDAKFWVGCMSHDKGPITKNYYEIGCISCKICEKNCPTGAIKVDEGVASIDYSLCSNCGECEKRCPRKIIWSDKSQSQDGIIRFKQDLSL
jgi:heterodisulfide reductase subunit A-like polyferredoxin